MDVFKAISTFPHLIARKSKFGQIRGSEKEIIRPRIPAQKEKQKKINYHQPPIQKI